MCFFAFAKSYVQKVVRHPKLTIRYNHQRTQMKLWNNTKLVDLREIIKSYATIQIKISLKLQLFVLSVQIKIMFTLDLNIAVDGLNY